LVSKVSSKGQVTIPKKVRDSLRTQPGDWIEYELLDGVVMIRRADSLDRAFHSALSETLTEWSSSEDEEAFGDL
jgi:antitoxin PrlF